jgi:hypothetical protein
VYKFLGRKKNLKDRNNWEDTCKAGRIILKKKYGRAWIKSTWLRIGASRGLL